MDVREILLKEAVVFAEDLIVGYFGLHGVNDVPLTAEERYQPRVRVRFNNDILRVVVYFNNLVSKPYYRPNFFPEGYNAMAFLHYCGKVANEALRDHRSEIKEASKNGMNSIISCLEEFIDSGEFESGGGWTEIKDMSSKLRKWYVFTSVVCIGNKYFDMAKFDASNGPETTSPEKS